MVNEASIPIFRIIGIDDKNLQVIKQENYNISVIGSVSASSCLFNAESNTLLANTQNDLCKILKNAIPNKNSLEYWENAEFFDENFMACYDKPSFARFFNPEVKSAVNSKNSIFHLLIESRYEDPNFIGIDWIEFLNDLNKSILDGPKFLSVL